MGNYISPKAIKWALGELQRLPKNQTVLLYFLIFSKSPNVDRSSESKSEFEDEFYRYFGGRIRGEGCAVFDPFAGAWRAENYINSTVYGRLLVGGHRWTEGEESFFERLPPSSGWPAKFIATEKGLENLLYRSSPPNLKRENRLPIHALATYYYRFSNLDEAIRTNQDLVEYFRQDILGRNSLLVKLFVEGLVYPHQDFVQSAPLSESEMVACYPQAPFSNKECKNVRLYRDDIHRINKRLKTGQTIADYISTLIAKECV